MEKIEGLGSMRRIKKVVNKDEKDVSYLCDDRKIGFANLVSYSCISYLSLPHLASVKTALAFFSLSPSHLFSIVEASTVKNVAPP